MLVVVTLERTRKCGPTAMHAQDGAQQASNITAVNACIPVYDVRRLKRVSNAVLIHALRDARLLGPATHKWTEAPANTKRRRASKEQSNSLCDSDFFPVELTTPQLLVALSSGTATFAPQTSSNISTQHELICLRAVACRVDGLVDTKQSEFRFASSQDQIVYESIISTLNALDILRLQVFGFLWQRGLTVLGGDTYGADFLSYSGDPNKVHSSAVILVLPWIRMSTDQQPETNMTAAATDSFSAQQLTSFASVAKIARKQALVASVNPDTDTVVMLDASLIVSSNSAGAAAASVARLLD